LPAPTPDTSALSTGAIVGIALGSVGGVGLVGVGLYCLYRKGSLPCQSCRRKPELTTVDMPLPIGAT
jgi:hypothetical protein